MLWLVFVFDYLVACRYRRVLDAVFPKMVCPPPHRAGRKCCFGVLALFDPPSVLMVAPVVLVFQQHKPKGVCLFILETNERLVQHAAHHYTTKALDRPWSNAV